MNELSLFTGGGGGIWGSKLLGWRTVGYVEIDDYCRRVIQARIRDGYFDDAPIFPDVRTFDGLPYRGRVDIVTAGFPCQPFSRAARGRNPKESLLDHTIRVIEQVGPAYALIENVRESRRELERGIAQLNLLGFRARIETVSAADLGAPYLGERLWLVAETNRNGEPTQSVNGKVARLPKISSLIWTDVEPEDLRMDDGNPARSLRLAALGNSQCPAMVVEAWERLTGNPEGF